MQKIKSKIESMADDAEVTFVAANNHPRAQAAANAVELKSLLLGEKVDAPETLVKAYPVLEQFASAQDTDLEMLSEAGRDDTQSSETNPKKAKGKKRNHAPEQQDLPL